MSTEIDRVIDSEIIADLTESDATAVTARIRAWVNACPIDDIKRAFFGRVWLAMGYESWSEWCECELNGFALPAVERREVVAELAGSGMSNRAIADVIGVDEKTIRNDNSTAEYSAVDSDRKTVGKDGKSRPAHRPSLPRRRPPLTEDFIRAALDLDRVISRLDKLANDDRFRSNKEMIRNRIRPYIDHGREVINGLDTALVGNTGDYQLSILLYCLKHCVDVAGKVDWNYYFDLDPSATSEGLQAVVQMADEIRSMAGTTS